MPYKLSKNYHFYAAHRHELHEGKCKYLHGHTYHIEVHFTFPSRNDETGVTVFFDDVDKVAEKIVKNFDHATIVSEQDMNLMQCVENFPNIFGKIFYMKEVSSVENIARKIYDLMFGAFKVLGCNEYLSGITIKETTSSSITYYKF